MKLNSDADIERIAKAIEKDAGHHIDSIRDALKDVRDKNTGQVHSHEQLLVRAARAKSCLSQSAFAAAINTPTRTLQEWEQGSVTPPGAALKLCELILYQPDLLST